MWSKSAFRRLWLWVFRFLSWNTIALWSGKDTREGFRVVFWITFPIRWLVGTWGKMSCPRLEFYASRKEFAYKQTLTLVLKLLVSHTATVKKVGMCWVTEVWVPAVGGMYESLLTTSTPWPGPVAALCNGFRRLFAVTKSSPSQADHIRVPFRHMISHSYLCRSKLRVAQKQATFFVVTKN